MGRLIRFPGGGRKPSHAATAVVAQKAANVEQTFGALPRQERDALTVLAAHEPLPSRTRYHEWIKAAGATNARGASLSAAVLATWMKRWRETGLISGGDGAGELLCHPEVAHAALVAADESLLLAIERPTQTQWGYGEVREIARARVAIYRGDPEAIAAALSRIPRWEIESDAERLMQLVGRSPAPGRIELLPPVLLASVACSAVVGAVSGMRPGIDAWWAAHGCFDTGTAAQLAPWFAMDACFRGDFDRAVEALGEEQTPEAACARAAVELFRGDPGAGRAVADAALEMSRGTSGRQKPSFRGPGGPWAALLALTGSTSTRSVAWSAVNRSTHRRKGEVFPGTYTELSSLGAELMHRTAQQPRRFAFGGDLDACLSLMIEPLALLWSGGEPRRTDAAGTKRLARRMREIGWVRLAAELESLCGVGGAGGVEASLLAALRRDEEPWELLLQSLELVAETVPENEASAATDARLSFAVAVDHGELRMEPRLHKRGVKSWTKGRKVGLAKLHKGEGLNSLPEEDRRIVANLKQLVERDNEYGWGPRRTVLRWGPRTPLALVGHPRIVDSATGDPVEAIRTTPELKVTSEGGELRLTISPPVSASGVFCAMTPGRLLVYEATEAHATLARTLANASARRATIPEAHQNRLKKTLSKLTGAVKVTGDISLDDGTVTLVEADARVRVLLWRTRPGLKFRLVVKPFGDGGPSLTPGSGTAVLATQIDGKAKQVRRDTAAEGRAYDAVLEACPAITLAEPRGPDLRLTALEDCYEMLTELRRLGDDVLLEWPEGEPLNIVAEAHSSALRVNVTSSDEWLRADVSLEVERGHVVKLRELLALLSSAQGRFVELEGDRVLALTENVKRKLERLAQLGTLRKNGVDVHALAAPNLASWLEDLEGNGPSRARELLAPRLERFEEAQALSPDPCRTLEAELRDYQLEGYRWMRRLIHWGAGPLLADDMGLGKTVQALSVLLDEATHGPALVVAPTSVCSHWGDQARRFAPALNVLHFGDGDRQAQLDALGCGDVLIASYGLLQREIERLAKVSFRVAVLDEAQAIKNPQSQRAQAACALDAQIRIISTGTPIENHLGELWSLMQFANAGLLGSLKHFERRFARPIQEHGDRHAAEALRQLVRPFILRRTKSEVLDELPPKTEIDLKVQLSPEESALYESIRQEAAEQIGESVPAGQQRIQILTALTRLRQAACHPSLVGGPDVLRATAAATSAKHETLLALVDELRDGGHRALVFSQFVKHLDLVRGLLDKRQIPYQYLDGSTPARQRQARVDAFQQGEGDLFLISLRAGGTGLNLTAADYVIHLDPWWNPAVETQASDRAHRIGQSRPVTVYRLIAEGTVEERILSLHGSKRQTAEQLLDGTNQSGPLDMATLKSLLEQV